MPTSSRMRWPYPSEDQNPWYEAFKGLVAALDASGYASREDRHLIVAGGGTLSWAAPVFTWTDTIKISAAIPGFLWQLAAGSVSIDDGQVLYVTLTRGITANQTVTPSVANQVPSSDQTLVLAVRIGTRLYLRSGVSIADGGSITEFSPSPGGTSPDRYAPAIIVGNEPNGDTLLGCHYLDTGNGAQLAAAIAAAGAGADIYIRPGTYNFAAVGGPTNAPTIPAGVRVRGAGRGHTFVNTRGSGDQRAFVLSERSEVLDLTVQVTLPTGAPSASYGVVQLSGDHCEMWRLNVDFLGVWTSVEAANFDPVACFFVMSGASDTKIVDCTCGHFGDGDMPSMWTLTSGSQALYGIYTEGSPESIGCDIVRFKTLGGDGGVRAIKQVRVRDAEISDPLLVGIELLGAETIGSEVTGTLIEMDADAAGRWGILLSATSECDIEGNRIVAWTGDMGAVGIEVESSVDCIIAKNRLPDNWGIGINLDADTENNIVGFNNMPLCYLVNSGTGNEVAHNINADLPID